MCVHRTYCLLNCWMDVEFWILYVNEFQIELPEKTEGLAKYRQVRFGDVYLICRWWNASYHSSTKHVILYIMVHKQGVILLLLLLKTSRMNYMTTTLMTSIRWRCWWWIKQKRTSNGYSVIRWSCWTRTF